MADFLTALRNGPLLADGGIGSYIFELTGRLSDSAYVYEGLNLSNPDLVRGVHLAYLQSGARCLTTNTFAANRQALAAAGLADNVAEINRAGVRLAREAVKAFAAQDGIAADYYVLGSVGPVTDGGDGGVRATCREQIEALGESDAILLETFRSLAQARHAVEAWRDAVGAPPLVLHLAVQQRQADGTWAEDPAEVVREAARLGVSVVGANCCAPWEASAFVEAVSSLPEVRSGKVLVSAMPNAGGFERIGHRFLSRVTPEFMGRLARSLADRNARLIGGCCEVHPQHIAEMRNYLLPASTGARAASAPALHGRPPAGPAEKKGNGKFSAKLFAGQFAVSVEVLPPRGTGPQVIDDKVGFIRELAASGLADAVDITDGSRGIPLMPPGDFIALARERLGWTAATGDGLELVPHLTTRDLNTMGLQGRLIGYHARRIHNVLVITGDPPKMSPTYPRSTAVFDLDSASVVRHVHAHLNAGMDFGSQPLGRQADPRTHFTIGSGFEPEAVNMERELEKLRRKLDAGVDYIFTQPVFRRGPLDAIRPHVGQVRVFAGVMVLSSLEHARRVAQVPGVVIPDTVLSKLSRSERPEDQLKAGIELAASQVRQARSDGWAGVYLMSPSGHEHVIEILRAGLT